MCQAPGRHPLGNRTVWTSAGDVLGAIFGGRRMGEAVHMEHVSLGSAIAVVVGRASFGVLAAPRDPMLVPSPERTN
ncbi:hypothetical protein ACFQZZ_26555 [Nocardia sp. GCM10030253]|uniref:hypothetical protein n=1 Tax=Nocardia sp. GCM10030253 TaxID=3273404 RepID=UPI0036347A55